MIHIKLALLMSVYLYFFFNFIFSFLKFTIVIVIFIVIVIVGTLEDGIKIGQILIISNFDTEVTSGAASIPSGSTVLLVFDGEDWVDVEALRAPVQSLTHVQRFEAENDLNMGNYTFTAGRLKATRMKKGAIPVAASDGLLIDTDKFTFIKGKSTSSSSSSSFY